MAQETRVGGYRVVGRDTANYSLHIWAFPDEEKATAFAKQLCEDTLELVEVSKLLGVWRPVKPPVEYTPEDKLRK